MTFDERIENLISESSIEINQVLDKINHCKKFPIMLTNSLQENPLVFLAWSPQNSQDLKYMLALAYLIGRQESVQDLEKMIG